MPKKSTRKPDRSRGRTKKLRPLTGSARDVFDHVLNSIAFEQYGDCCAVDALAEEFGKTPGRLQPTIRKLIEEGYVTVEGDIFQIIYPTVAALRRQDPKLSRHEAEEILAKVRGRRR